MADQAVVSWDGHNINDGINYEAGFRPGLEWGLPKVDAELVSRTGRWPLVGAITRPGVRVWVQITIKGSPLRTLRDQLTRWFDPEDETPKQLIIEDDDGSDDRYVYAICEALQPVVNTGLAADEGFIATLAVHGDVRWRDIFSTIDTWSVTGSPQTHAFVNGGTDDAYPIVRIQPTAGLTGGYSYRRWIPIRWRVDVAYDNYPIDICNDSFDTQALVGAGKMQADGDDLRVWVDGAEVDRWLDGINTATTKVWCHLNFEAMWEGTLATAIAGGGAVDTIDVNEDTTGAPSSGIMMIGSEAFTYTGKNDSLKRFIGVIRSAKGTTPAAHNVGDPIWWCQHDVWILYGNGAATAPSVDADYEPAFELDHSTNISWVYEEFGEDDGLRPGQWATAPVASVPSFYHGNHGATANPWVEMGIALVNLFYGSQSGRVYAYNPCGITAADFASGEKYAYSNVGDFEGLIESKTAGGAWTTEDTIPDPANPATWEAWADNEVLQAGAVYVGVKLTRYVKQPVYCEFADCTLTLNGSYTPTLTIGAEQGNYSLDAVITNQATGDAIQVTHTMSLGQELEIDTDAKTVTLLDDDSSAFQALTLLGGARREWLRLLPGSNTLRYEQTGTNAVTVTVLWTERFY